MSKILSQEEIDALLSNITAVPEEGGQSDFGTEDSQLYDFKHPERISKEQIRTLRTIHDGFARMFATYLSTTLRTLVDVNLLSIDQVTFSEYSLSLSVPNALYLLKMKELEGKALIEISPQFILFVVDRMLGGMGETDIESREISQIEQNVVRRVIQTIVNQLNEVWKQVFPLQADLDGFESDPQFVQIARSSDTLAIIFFDIRVRGATYTLNLAFPYFTLEPIMNKLSAQSMMAMITREVEPSEVIALTERIKSSSLPVAAVIARTNIKVADIIELKVDDLIQLEKRTSEPFEILVANKLKYFGTPGRLGRREAVKVIRSISPEEELIYE